MTDPTGYRIEEALRKAQAEQQERAEASHRKLHHEMTEAMIQALQYLDVREVTPELPPSEMVKLMHSGFDRYRTDSIFHAKVTMLVSDVFDVLRKNRVEV